MKRTTIEARVEKGKTKYRVRWGVPLAALVASCVYLTEGGRLPNGWGIAWWEADRLAWAILPIPFNIIFGLARKLYWTLAFNRWSATKRDKELMKARSDAFRLMAYERMRPPERN